MARKRGKKMCSDGLSESSGFKPAKGTRCFLHQLIFSSRCDFPLRFRADIQPTKNCTSQQISRMTEFKVSREYVMVKGGERGLLRGRGIGVELRGGNWMGNLR